MSEETKMLKTLLEKLRLGEYFKKFQEAKMLYSDLEDIDEEELTEVIPKKFLRRRLLKHLESVKGSGKTKQQELRRDEPKFSEKVDEEEEDGECVQMLVKWDEQVAEVFDVPLDISNEELNGKLLQEFLTCRIKLQGEERMLVKKSKKFNLKRWFVKSGLSEEDTIRAVLKVEGEMLKGGRKSSKEEELKEEVEKLKKENEKLEGTVGKREEQLIERDKALRKRVKEVEQRDEVIGKLKRENDRCKKENYELKKEIGVLKENIKAKESRPGEGVEMERTTLTATTESSGIVIPKIRFVENDRTSGVFSNGNKRAKSNKGGFMVFKGNYVFEVGKKYYFQASYRKSGYAIGIGVLRGDFENKQLGSHAKGWECYCHYTKLYCKDKCTSRSYGPRRGKSASVGVLVDFTNGKREMSFFFDGKNCGVAFRDVEPPVSPAFYFYWDNGDTWEIEDVKELPKGL